jgi:hypothetical protein
MPISEFRECMLFEQIEPFGERRQDYRIGILAALLANIHRKKDAQPFKPQDFMLPWDPVPPPREQTVEEQVNIFHMIMKAQNALVENQKRRWPQSPSTVSANSSANSQS